jgi:hypothetical protein
MKLHFREHRGGLGESMETAVVVDGTDGLVAHLRTRFGQYFRPNLRREDIIIEPHGGDDDRIGWKNVHIVCTDRACSPSQPPWGPLGFCAAVDGSAPA